MRQVNSLELLKLLEVVACAMAKSAVFLPFLFLPLVKLPSLLTSSFLYPFTPIPISISFFFTSFILLHAYTVPDTVLNL